MEVYNYIYYFYKNIKLNFLKNMHTKKNLVVNRIPDHHSETYKKKWLVPNVPYMLGGGIVANLIA